MSISILPLTIYYPSNDYLGLTHEPYQGRLVNHHYQILTFTSVATNDPILGAIGSRFLLGNSIYAPNWNTKYLICINTKFHYGVTVVMMPASRCYLLSPKTNNKNVVIMDELRFVQTNNKTTTNSIQT